MKPALKIWTDAPISPFKLENELMDQFIQKFRDEKREFIVVQDSHDQFIIRRDSVLAVQISNDGEFK